MKKLKILIACECSGRVREAFRKRGHDAWSCDIKPSEDNSPFHIQGDVLPVLKQSWDMMIAFPPCTHLACSGAAWFEKKRADGRQQEGIDFFMQFTQAPIKKICIENPVGIMSRLWREPDQIIQPYYFGDEAQKTTCLWLKNLYPLPHAAEDDWFLKKTHSGKGEFYIYTNKSGKNIGKVNKQPLWYAQAKGFGGKATGDHAETRSRTFPGIANAMAENWG